MTRKIAPAPTGRKSVVEDDSVVVTSSVERERANKQSNPPDADEVPDGPIQSRSQDQGFLKRIVLKMHKQQSQKEWVILITVVTMYALFGDDLRLALFSKSYDDFFFLLSTFSLLMFAKELIISVVADPVQSYGFYFWLDFIATVTMIPDIGWVWDPVVNLLVSDTDSAINGVTRGLQASRVGSKSGRIVRIVRLVRLVRIAKLWKVHRNRKENNADDFGEEPSVVGKKLSEMTMRRVITIVLVMLISLQFLDDAFWSGGVNRQIWDGLSTLHRMSQDYNVSSPQFEFFIQKYVRDSGRVINLRICSLEQDSSCRRFNSGPGSSDNSPLNEVDNNWKDADIEKIAKNTRYGDDLTTLKNPDDPDYLPNDSWRTLTEIDTQFRNTEVEWVSYSTCYNAYHELEETSNTTCRTQAAVDISVSTQLSASLNIARTVFVIVVLAGGSALFTKDADTLVIAPIERMVACVRELAENPMGSTNRDDDEDDDDLANSGYETLLLERTIKKIGKLLQVGFGEAGSAIINKNMLSSGGVIDPMIKGQKITAVFGFCDIRNFTDTTECLKTEVMVYVNKVGDIVHSATHAFHGAANKNIGDAFLLVWRIEDSPFDNDAGSSGGNSSFWFQSRAGNMCDNALIAFLKILVDLKRENKKGGCLYTYKKHHAIQKRFGNDFEIKMGMGLHIGWAIEGAIGSHHKIDASYLSPNVNMSSRLEAATKQFGTPLLLSHWFVDGLTSAARKRCRQIDRVTVKGSLDPMGLWTFDINTYPECFAELELSADKKRQNMNFILETEIPSLQVGVEQAFYDMFLKGLNNYLDGEWLKSHHFLKEALKVKGSDGPAESLIRVMEKLSFEAPAEWPGYRELTEK